MADYTVSALAKRKDPLLSFHWGCINDVIVPTSGLKLPGDYVESIDLPFNNIQVAEGHYGASGFTYFPGSHDVSAFSMTFYEDVSCTTLKFINDWKSQVKSWDGTYNLPIQYKGDILVALFDPKGKVVLQAKMIGCWPSDTGNLSLNYNDSGRLVITQTFSVDDQELLFTA